MPVELVVHGQNASRLLRNTSFTKAFEQMLPIVGLLIRNAASNELYPVFGYVRAAVLQLEPYLAQKIVDGSR
jgi:hypothetical protein